MSTRSLTITAGLALAAAALCWAAWDADDEPSPGATAAAPAAAPSEPAPAITAASFLPDAPAPQRHRLPPRPVKPVVLGPSVEENMRLVQPILDALPNLSRNDVYKLGYFCPADFNKDDRIDEQDFTLFAQTWADENSPLFNWCDMNKDGVVDESDAIEFLHEYREGSCNCEELRDLRSTIC